MAFAAEAPGHSRLFVEDEALNVCARGDVVLMFEALCRTTVPALSLRRREKRVEVDRIGQPPRGSLV